MADINQRIKNIQEFFVGMQVQNVDNEVYIYVTIKIPTKWRIDYDETLKRFQVETAVDQTVPGQYYFITKMEVGFDVIFDAIDFNIENMRAIAERSNLLKQKIAELQLIFENKEITIDSLRTLEFKYKLPKKKTLIPKKENNTEEVIEEENE